MEIVEMVTKEDVKKMIQDAQDTLRAEIESLQVQLAITRDEITRLRAELIKNFEDERLEAHYFIEKEIKEATKNIITHTDGNTAEIMKHANLNKEEIKSHIEKKVAKITQAIQAHRC